MRSPTGALVVVAVWTAAAPARGDDPPLPPYLKDRGTGVPTSLFGTYVRRGELIVYPFFEHYRDGNLEYKPEEYGAPGSVDSPLRPRRVRGRVPQ